MKKQVALLMTPSDNEPQIINVDKEYLINLLGEEYKETILTDDLCLLCNKDGIEISDELPICKKIDNTYLLGDLVLIGYDKQNSKYCSLTESQLEFYKKEFSEFEIYVYNMEQKKKEIEDSNLKVGSLIIIGKKNNEISQHFSCIESYGLLVSYKVLKIDDENVYVKDYTIDKDVAIPFDNIYKVFNSEDDYRKWRKDYMDENETKIQNAMEQKIEEHYKKMPSMYISNKHFYESALCDIVYNDFVNKEKEMER